MKIIVPIKQVPERDAHLRIDDAHRWIDDQDVLFALNESDAYALEQALQLKERQGGEVIVVSAGPERALITLREALAKGADRAIFIETNDLSGNEGVGARDALGVARLLAAVIQPEAPDLVLTGLQSDDLGQGLTGGILGELLGMPYAALVLMVDPSEGGVRIKRELEEGWFQYIEIPLPAVLAMQSGGTRLRYSTLMGIKKAKSKEVRQIAASELAVDRPATVVLERVALPRRTKSTQRLTGTAQEAALALVEKLRFERRVI